MPSSQAKTSSDREVRLRSVESAAALDFQTTSGRESEPRADWRERFSWRWITFIAAVVIPVVFMAVYLYGFATDQYVSEFRFRLRHSEPSRMSAASALSGLTGAASVVESMTDSQIVVQYLQSRQLLDDLKPQLDIGGIYDRPEADWFSRLDANAPIETKVKYLRSIIDPFFDASDGIVTVKVRAFNPADAAAVSNAVLGLAEKLVNNLSDRAQTDKLAYASKGVADKAAALRTAELAMRRFRNANAIVFPTMQATEESGLDSKLRTTVSNDRVALESLRRQGVTADAPQLRGLESEIKALELELARLQTGVTRGGSDSDSDTTSPTLASLLATYDELDVEDKIAAKAYEVALTAEQQARDEANQQQIYLDAFVRPATPEQSLYPIRWRLLLQVGLASFAAWCLGLLLWRAVMDHLD